MLGDATLFTRNDEVEAAVGDLRPDPRELAEISSRRCETYAGGHAGASLLLTS